MFETLVGIDNSGKGHMENKLQLNINGWGTKWDVLGTGIYPSYTETSIDLNFDTAWSPPIGFCQMLSEKYHVKCVIQYEEGGNDFCGKTIVENGEIISEEDYSYREGLYIFNKEGFWNEIQSDIDTYVSGKEFFNDNFKNNNYLIVDDKNEIISMFNNLKNQ